MALGAIVFQNQGYRICQDLYQTSHFTVYELIDPVELGGRKPYSICRSDG